MTVSWNQAEVMVAHTMNVLNVTLKMVNFISYTSIKKNAKKHEIQSNNLKYFK